MERPECFPEQCASNLGSIHELLLYAIVQSHILDMPRQLHLKGYEFIDKWRDTLHLAALECAKRKRVKIYFVSFLSSTPADVALAESEGSIKIEKKTDYWAAQLSEKKSGKTFCLDFGIFRSAVDAWTLFTLTESNWRENVLLHLVGSLSPDFSLPYLSSADIRHLFQKLEEDDAVEISVNKAVAYSYRREGQISFKKEPYQDVFNRAEHENMFIDKVDFSLHGQHSLHAFVARNGTAKFIGGDIDIFLDRILNGVLNTSARKHEVFQQAARRPGEIEVSPVDIDFGQSVFQGRGDNLTFLSSLDGLTRSGIAVMHENPYVHVSLIDFFDGSSFDIFATSPNSVSIIPQVDASAFSLNRLCNHIFENFREGVITRPQPRTWNLADVLT